MRANDIRSQRELLQVKEALLERLSSRYQDVELAISDVRRVRRAAPRPDHEFLLIGRFGLVDVIVPVEVYEGIAVVDSKTAPTLACIEIAGRPLGAVRALTRDELRSMSMPAPPRAPVPSRIGMDGVDPVDYFDYAIGCAVHALLGLTRKLGATAPLVKQLRWTVGPMPGTPSPTATAGPQASAPPPEPAPDDPDEPEAPTDPSTPPTSLLEF